MAKRKNSKNQTEDKSLEVEESLSDTANGADDTPAAEADDAVVMEEPDAPAAAEAGDEISEDAPKTDESDVVEDTAQAETVFEPDADTETVEDAVDGLETASDDTLVEDAPVEDTPAQVEKIIETRVVEQKGGFLPTAIGGVVAAAVGYGAAAYVAGDIWPFGAADDGAFEAEARAALQEQSDGLANITAQLSDLGARLDGIDLSPLESSMTATQDAIGAVETAQSGLNEALSGLAGRIDALEKQPMEQAVSPEAIAAYERALDELRAEIDAQRDEVANMAQQAMQAEENSEENARLSAARAALAKVASALVTGDAFAADVSALGDAGVEVPEALSAVASDGVTTQAALIGAFPEAARAALSSARADATESAEGSNRMATFLRNQLGARSVTPKEGDDPDAVLSRAEAAVRNGALDVAMDEIAKLPEAAQTALADWRALAQSRLEAQNAADTLAQQLIQE